jgi:hypothetical protein
MADAYWERVLSVSRAAVQKARVGVTWQTHPTPPDTKPRSFAAGDKPRESGSSGLISRALANWQRVKVEVV